MAELVAPVDTVSVCFSKGLGAPMGSAILGTADAMKEALRYRRMFGGALRQSGIVCAAALYALEHHRERVEVDHENARRLAEGLSALEGLRCDPATVETNIVQFVVEAGDAHGYTERAAAAGVLVGPLDDRRIRAVTHLDVDAESIDAAVERLGTLAQ